MPPARQSPLADLLARVERGETDVPTALAELGNRAGFSDLGFARIDHDRGRRCGFPEFVFGEGKTAEQAVAVIRELRNSGSPVLATRVSPATAAILIQEFPDGRHDEAARTFLLAPPSRPRGRVVVVTAGTTDLPVAREAVATCTACGCGVDLVADAGVAGIHRLLAETDRLRNADAVIVVAGMEGALPSAVGGLVSCPVIAVPTSVGYGTALGGLTALFAMLNSCANGVAVMNIDNGFGAGCAAARILYAKYGPPD
jgi:NCAIR mutase (PurE)-related protein